MTEVIGFIGAGQMGEPMVRLDGPVSGSAGARGGRWRQSGFEVVAAHGGSQGCTKVAAYDAAAAEAGVDLGELLSVVESGPLNLSLRW